MKLPQLALRELFWLILVCALALGWWLDQHRLWLMIEHQAREAAKQRMDQYRVDIDSVPRRH